MTKPIYVLNGPNLNRLGLREPDLYGSTTLEQVEQICRDAAGDRAVEFRQTNSEERLIDLVRRYARAQGLTERLFEFPMPGPYGTAMRDGTLLTRPGSDLGTHTFDDWLATLPATW